MEFQSGACFDLCGVGLGDHYADLRFRAFGQKDWSTVTPTSATDPLSCSPNPLQQVGAPVNDRACIESDTSTLGRFLVTKKEANIASFKAPNIRNVLVTGPYFHDGSQETLWDVMDHYNKGAALQNPYLDEDTQPLAPSENDIDDLVAFMASLTSANYKEQGVTELARQRALSQTNRPQRDTARAFGPKPPRPAPPR
jgi:cytochrome c peroxidase